MRATDRCIHCGTTRSESFERSMGMYCPRTRTGMHEFSTLKAIKAIKASKKTRKVKR